MTTPPVSTSHAQPGIPTAPRGFDAFGVWFSLIFRLWQAQWKVYVLQGLIVTLCSFLLPLVAGIIVGIAVGMEYQAEMGFLAWELITIYGSMFFLSLSLLLLGPGILLSALKQLHGEEIAVSDLFSGLRYVWSYFVISLVSSLGYLACGIGMYATCALELLALPMLIDRRLRTVDAISLSWRTVATNFWMFVLYTFVLAFMSMMGMYVIGFGLCVTLPWLFIGTAIAYEGTCNPWNPLLAARGTAQPAVAPHAGIVPPPYLPPQPQTVPACPQCGTALEPGQAVCARCAAKQG